MYLAIFLFDWRRANAGHASLEQKILFARKMASPSSGGTAGNRLEGEQSTTAAQDQNTPRTHVYLAWMQQTPALCV